MTSQLTMTSRLTVLAMTAGKLAAAACLAAFLIAPAQAQEKNFGKQWAWNNDFNGSKVSASFGSGSTPSESFSYNFSSSGLYAYPACCLGWHYGYNPTGDTSELPKQLTAIGSAPTNFSYTSYGSNMAGDFAYDMFLRFDNQTSTPQLEVMVWGGNNSYPIGTRTASNVLTAGGITFDLWEGTNSGAGYYVYTFCPHNTGGGANLPTGGNVNVDQKVFFNWLAANRTGSHFNSSMYLDVIEAGLEIVRGNGGASISANLNVYAAGSGGGTTANGTYHIVSRADGNDLDNIGNTAAGSAVGQWSSSGSANQQWKLNYSGGYYTIQNSADGNYLDSLGHTGNGTGVGQYPASGSANQQWSIAPTDSGYYTITNRASGECLDTGGLTATGSAVQQWGSSSSYNQQWKIQ